MFFNDEISILNIDNGVNWVFIKYRLLMLLDLLEKLGCFILKKGIVEGYYQYVFNLINDEKLNVVFYEVNGLMEVNIEVVIIVYDDIFSVLKYCF